MSLLLQVIKRLAIECFKHGQHWRDIMDCISTETHVLHRTFRIWPLKLHEPFPFPSTIIYPSYIMSYLFFEAFHLFHQGLSGQSVLRKIPYSYTRNITCNGSYIKTQACEIRKHKRNAIHCWCKSHNAPWLEVNMWCDQAKWVGTRKYWFWDIGKQSGLVSLFPFVFATLQLPVSLEPIAQSPWGFHQIKA